MKILRVKLNQAPEIADIPDTLDTLQFEVKGYIEVIDCGCYQNLKGLENCSIVCNDEAKLMGLEPNLYVTYRGGYDTINGDFILVGNDGEEFGDLTDDEIEIMTRIVTNQRGEE